MKAYPYKARIGGKIYDIRTNYKYALKCLEILNDSSISKFERIYGSIITLFGVVPDEDEIAEFYEKMILFLGCGETQEQQHSKPADIDLNYDFGYISASFRSDYNIDIRNTDMHWYEFVNLVSGLTEKSVMSRVRDIRNYDLSKVKDPQDRAKIQKAKDNVALPEKQHLSYEQIEAIDEFERLLKGG